MAIPGSRLLAKLVLNLYQYGGLALNRVFTNAISASFRELGRRTTIHRPFTVFGEASISIGKGAHIGPDSWLLCLERPDHAGDPLIRIGDGCSFAGGLTITAAAGVTIGDEVLVGRNVHISDHAHEFRKPDVPVIHQGITEARPVWIGDGAWIGQGVVICPGVRIGRGSVIGANSVVKSDVPDRCVAVGSPARIIRRIDAD